MHLAPVKTATPPRTVVISMLSGRRLTVKPRFTPCAEVLPMRVKGCIGKPTKATCCACEKAGYKMPGSSDVVTGSGPVRLSSTSDTMTSMGADVFSMVGADAAEPAVAGARDTSITTL